MKQTLPKLPKAFKNKWIKALTSGKYVQGTSTLVFYDQEYCCLGVAGHICGIDNKSMENKGTFQNGLALRAVKKGLPEILTGSDGLAGNPLVHKLTNFNDNGKSFKWIAAWIKRYL